jgi:glycosyltransferase involved in cell wall biosynthesis
LPITVIHVVQLGPYKETVYSRTENKDGNLQEFIYTFPFRKTGIGLLDKVLYNQTYIRFYTKILETYIQQNGLPDIVHVHVPMKAGLAAIQLKKKYKIPFIVSEQASYYEPAAPDTFSKRSWFFRKNTAKIFQLATITTNVSDTIGKKIQQMFQLNAVVPIHNVVNTNVFYSKPKTSHSIFRWLHVSTLGEQKNIHGMLQAFQILNKQVSNNWHLTLVGPLYKQYKQLIIDFNLIERVTFTGELQHNAVAIAMQNADAFVLFSKHENFPCVIPEALCCGLPVVAANVGGIAEAIHTNNGVVVNSEDIVMLANALAKIMQNSSNFLNETIAKDAQRKYSNTVIGNQFIQLYKKMM